MRNVTQRQRDCQTVGSRLQAEEERKRQREEEASKAAIAEMYDEVQSRIDADALSAEIRSRPPTKSQLRNLMMTYMKNMGGYKHSQLKAKSFEEIKGMYKRHKKSFQDFVPIGFTEEENLIKKMNEKETGEDTSNKEKVLEEPNSTKVEVKQEGNTESTRKRPGERLKIKAIKKSKRQKTDSDLKEEEQLKDFLVIVPDEEGEINYDVLDKRNPILDSESIKINQEEWILKSWNFYDNRGVHILVLEDGTEFYMLAERRYPLLKETLERMLALRLIAEYESDAVFDLLRFIQNKELASPKQTTLGKDISNPLIVDSLLKTIWLSMHHVITIKHWLFQSKRLLGRIVGFQKFLQLSAATYTSYYCQFYLVLLIYSMAGSDDENPPPPPPPQTPTQQAPHTVSTIKLPILKKGEYDIWAMKMEHYLSHTDYPIWEVIQKGNGPDDCSESSRVNLRFLVTGVSTEDANQKFLRSLHSSWSQVSLVMRTKPGVCTDVRLWMNKWNFALMAYSNSGSDTEVTSCSKECVESYAKLKKLYDEQREQLGDASIEIQAYTQALKKVEAQLVTHQKNQLLKPKRSFKVQVNPQSALKNMGIVVVDVPGTDGKQAYLAGYKTINGGPVVLEPVRSEEFKLTIKYLLDPKEANHSACTQDNIDVGNPEMESESAQDYFVLPIWSSYTLTAKSSEAKNEGEKPNKNTGLKTNEEPVDQEDQAFLEELERLKRQENEANDAAEALRKEFA
ncbi:hypothetical protein Tco_1405892 [Tanacetum coccineum]